jgi:antitoxin component of MazEF toxin-antitoxin module
MSRQTILKWGNSLAFRLPAAIARQLEVREGATVTYRVNGRRLIIEPSEPALPEYSAEDLRKALGKSRKALVGWGPPKGKEAW